MNNNNNNTECAKPYDSFVNTRKSSKPLVTTRHSLTGDPQHQQRLLTPEQIIKLRHFRRFLRSSGVTQFDFLLRVEEMKRSEEVQLDNEVDEDGMPAVNIR